MNPKVPRSFDVHGLPLPTALEIAEGAAYREWRRDPTDEEARDEHRNAWNALLRGQDGNIGTWRCSFCYLMIWGRPVGSLCTCGKFLKKREAPPLA